MKKLIIIFLLIFCLSGCENDIMDVSSNTVDNCNNKPQLLISQDDRKIYTYCLEDTMIYIGNNSIDLKKYIEDNNNAIDKIIDTLEYQDSFDDGGTKVYKGDNLALIKCNTLAGNKDIYIGDETMEFKENFCKTDNYTFVRTYTVKSIKEYTEQQYENGIPVSYGNSFEVNLSQFQGENETVIINNLWDITLEKNKIYEFEFMLYDDVIDIEDSIEYIFKNSTIVEVRETNKVGLDQIQDAIK